MVVAGYDTRFHDRNLTGLCAFACEQYEVLNCYKGLKKMKSDALDLPPQIPECNIRGRLLPTSDFIPRLKKICLSLGFNDPKIVRLGNKTDSSEPQFVNNGGDCIVILSAMIPYEPHWGGYSGLPGQQYRKNSCYDQIEMPSDFIIPFLQEYRFAQSQIRLGRDSAGKCIVMLPDFLVQGRDDDDGSGLRVIIEKIAEPNANGRIEPIAISGSFLTFVLAPHFLEGVGDGIFPEQTGAFISIGEHLTPDFFRFGRSSEPVNRPTPLSTILLPKMPWIVTHKTPDLAATLLLLQTNYLWIADAFASSGPDDLRNLLCVAGLDIDMRGFRGRKERYFVPWQACWKRNGYCYNNIYPLLQDDLFVALKTYNKMGFGTEKCDEIL